MLRKLDKFAGELYLSFYCATEYPEQKPEYKNAKWYHLFYLLIPIVGIILFTLSIEEGTIIN